MRWWLVIWFAPWLSASSASQGEPQEVWLWAWERPEDLSFLLGEADVGVAYLGATLRLERDDVRVVPRRQPIELPTSVPRLLVVRIETASPSEPSLSEAQRRRIVSRVERYVTDAEVTRLQIDFDAALSQRDFYAALLGDLRKRLTGVSVGITALASWCFEDRWLDALGGNAEEVVPMVFAMGRGGPDIRKRLGRYAFPEQQCRKSIGVHRSEPMVPLRGYRRVYAFSENAWSQGSYQELRRTIRGASLP